MKSSRIPLKAVDWQDETFRSSMERDMTALQESVGAVGVVCPPRVQVRGDGFRVISGFLRGEVCLSKGMTHMAVELREETDPEEALLLESLHENRFTRGFTWAERAWVLDRVTHGWGKPRSWILAQLMPALDLPVAERLLEEHLRVATLPQPVFRALARHGCSMANALRLLRWPAPDREALVPLLEALHLGENLLRECLDMIREIALREGLSPVGFLQTAHCRQILEDRERDRPRRTQDFRAYIRRRRYPTLVSMEEAFRKARAGLGLVQRQSVQASPFFEEEGVRVAFRARSAREFKDLSRNLWEASQREQALKSVFQATEAPPE